MNKKLLPFGLFLAFALIFNVTFAFAHSGHTHEEKIRISLPSVVAKVNGEDVSNDNILIELRKTLKGYKNRGLPLTIEEEKITAKKLIDNEIKRVLLLQKGNEIGSKITDKTVPVEELMKDPDEKKAVAKKTPAKRKKAAPKKKAAKKGE